MAATKGNTRRTLRAKAAGAARMKAITTVGNEGSVSFHRALGFDVVCPRARFLEERGVASEFVEGLRVSSPAVIDAVLKVFAGTVNHELVSTLVSAGLDAIGLTGIDAALTECEIVNPALGQVGRLLRESRPVAHRLHTR